MTFLLAKFFGIYFLAIGAAFIINPGKIQKLYEKMVGNEGLLYLGGIMALVIGAFVVTLHNIWVLDWPILITLIGWWGIIKGFCLIAFDDFAKNFSSLGRLNERSYRSIGTASFLLGLAFLYLSSAS